MCSTRAQHQRIKPRLGCLYSCVGERSNFKKIRTHTQDHGDGIATRGESVRPRTLVDRKRKRYNNAVDVVVRLHDPTDPSTERTAPPSSAHVQLNDDPRAPIQQSFGEEFHQHDGVVMILMFYRHRASPKHRYDITKVEYGGGGHRTRLRDQLSTCVSMGCPYPRV